MTTTATAASRIAHKHFRITSGRPTPPSRRRFWLWHGIAALCLTLILVVAHGCHSGDHDDELLLWLLERPQEQKVPIDAGQQADRILKDEAPRRESVGAAAQSDRPRRSGI
jgi:hypothetical protein